MANETVFFIADGALLICLKDKIARELIDKFDKSDALQPSRPEITGVKKRNRWYSKRFEVKSPEQIMRGVSREGLNPESVAGKFRFQSFRAFA